MAEAPRRITSRLAVDGTIYSGGVAVPTISSTSTLTNKTITAPVLSGTVTGTYTLAGTATLTAPTITAPVISGAATVASGAVITTPTATFTTAGVTGTGATGGSGAALPTVTPAFVTVTGATGSGVDLPTGPIGAAYYFQNLAAATMRFYCVGGTINGTTGTTAYTVTNTGNKSAWAFNTSATGAWFMGGNT